MKYLWRKLIYILLALCFPAFVLQILMIHGVAQKDTANILKTVNEECAQHFRNPLVLKKLSRVVAKGDPDEFMKIIQKYLPQCHLQFSEFSAHHGYGLIDPSISSRFPINISAYNITNTTFLEMIRNHSTPVLNLCPRQSPLLQGSINVDLIDYQQLRKVNGQYSNWPMTFEELAVAYPKLQVGGFYPGPENCRCRGYNAIIIPYRDRELHLRYFLYYIHQLLQRQQLCYVVIVSEQDDNATFNKGQLMNTAFNYARDLMSFDCYIFHDVDIIAEDDRVLYTCRDDSIMHLAPFIDKFKYEFIKGLTVGAVVGFTEDQFVAVNGYSNEYAGWGGEDDDMAERIKSKKIRVARSEEKYSRFKMIKHGHDKGNDVNEHRYQQLRHTRNRQIFEGLSGLDTVVNDNVLYKTHTRLKVKTYQTGLQRDLVKEDEKAKAKKQKKKKPAPKDNKDVKKFLDLTKSGPNVKPSSLKLKKI